MSDLIERIWNMECNNEQKHIERIENIKRINKELNEMEKVFLKNLSNGDKSAFDKIIDKYFEMLDSLLLDACLTGVKRTSFGTDKSPVFGVKIF